MVGSPLAKSEPPPVILIQELSFTYPGGVRALDGLSVEVGLGETVGLIGPNGAGKTTLFLCMAGVLPVRAGAIHLAGLDPARAEDRRRLPAHVGVVFQDSDDQLFNATVFDDVAFGPLNLGLPPEEVRRRVTEALDRVRLGGLGDRVPFHLSGGEKRRAALAGVLAMGPEILLLDEPSIHLDPRGRREFIGLIRQVPGTKIIAAHDLELIVSTCGRVLVIDGGRLAAEGPTRVLLADAGLMEAHGLEVPHSLTHHAEGDRHHQV
jgi:cobalt/nickel transport system ATP-binding protein